MFPIDQREGFRSPSYDLLPELPQVMSCPSTDESKQIISQSSNTLIWSGKIGTTPVIGKLYYSRPSIDWLRSNLTRFRTQREYAALSHLQRHQVASSRPVFWTAGYEPKLGGRFEALITETLPDAKPLKRWITRAETSSALQVMSKIGALIRAMHDTGLYHGALYTRNILICQSEAPTPYIIDTDAAIIFPRSLFASSLASIDLLCFCSRLKSRPDASQLIEQLLASYELPPRRHDHFYRQLNQNEKYPRNKELIKVYANLYRLHPRNLIPG